jgi:hypothetical protein
MPFWVKSYQMLYMADQMNTAIVLLAECWHFHLNLATLCCHKPLSTHSYYLLCTPVGHMCLGPQAVESCLMANLAEHMNAEIVLGTIKDVPGAIQWIKSSFLFTRVRSNPQHYG